MALEDMTGLEIVERLVEIGRTRRPASAALIDRVLGEVGLPPAPLYRELLLRTDGLEIASLCFLHVKKPGQSYLKEFADLYDPYIPVAFIGGAHLGWHREEKCWCLSAADDISDRYPDEETMFRVIAGFAKGFFPHVHVPARPRTVAPLEELVASIPDEWVVRKPRAVSVRDRVHRVFMRRAKIPAPDDYRALFDLCDGFEVNGLLIYSPRDLADKQLDLDDDDYIRVGIMDDQTLIYSALDSQWQLVDSGSFDPDDDDDRYQTFTEMIGTILPERLDDSLDDSFDDSEE